MKIYFHMCLSGFTNSYIILNDDPNVKQAIIIDPGQITNRIIGQIEEGGYKLTAVLITHAHENHIKGLKTLNRIYNPTIYACDSESYGNNSVILTGDGITRIAGINVEFFSVPGHSTDSMVYKIEEMLFTGDTLLSGLTGYTSSKYSQKLLLSKIRDKLFTLPGRTVIYPGHGAPSTIESERQYNIDMLSFKGMGKIRSN